MDEARRFRFLIPPFFLALSVAAGLYFSGFDFECKLKSYSNEQLVLFGALAGASILPIGFVLTTASILVIHAFARLRGFRTHEAILPPATWEALWPLLRTSHLQAKGWHLYASATFDHEMLSPGVHQWIQRRWTSFNLSAHSLAAIVLSHLVVVSSTVHETWQWAGLSLVLGGVFAFSASIAYRQTMEMLAFQASRRRTLEQQANRPLQPTTDGQAETE